MRITIIQDQLRIGGTERQSLQVARDLAAAGHEAVLLLFRPGGRLFEELDMEMQPVHILQPFNSGLSLWAPGLGKRIRQLSPDVILCMGRTANCYAGYLQKRFPGIQVVATVRTGKPLLPFHRWSLARADNIIVNSSWWRRELVKRGIEAGKISVIHNPGLLEPPPEDQQRHQRTKLREEAGAADKTCVFLNVANFRPGKRHKDLLRAFRELATLYPEIDWQLWLAGVGKTLGECRKWCTVNGLDRRVRFLEYQHDPAPLYAAADVAVSLSMEESLPNFLIEAQLMGLPVIARDYRGVKEAFEPGKSGILVKTSSPGMVVPLLRQLATKHALRQAYAGAALKTASIKFSRERQNRKLLDLLDRIKPNSD